MRKIYFMLLACLLFLTGCQQEAEATMPYREIKNPLTNRQVLILTHSSEYVLRFLEQLDHRANGYYSIVIDDLDNISEYNFATYNGVLIIEKLHSGSAPALDSYMEIYSGSNNIVLHGLDGNYTSPYPLSVITANARELETETLWDTAEKVYAALRTK